MVINLKKAVLGLMPLVLASCIDGGIPQEEQDSGKDFADAQLPVEALEDGPRLYVFDCGALMFQDVTNFGLSNEDTDVRELFVPCYLVEHDGRRLFWDGGMPLEIVGLGEVPLVKGSSARYERSVIDQLAELGLSPGDIEYAAFSHMHVDHAGAANAFTESTILIQRAEDEAAFREGAPADGFNPSLYMKLAEADRLIIDGDHDVFGDGRVKILSAPGHSPGHQVLWLDLDETGPLVLSGDLYHFRISRQKRSIPLINYDHEQTLASMEKVERVIERTGATLWISHDRALADTLKLSPAYYE